jgi:hypothetical protein
MNQEQRTILIIDSGAVDRDQYRHYLRQDAEIFYTKEGVMPILFG